MKFSSMPRPSSRQMLVLAALACPIVGVANSARAGAYNDTVLYSLSPPAGFRSITTFQIAANGQAVGYAYGAANPDNYGAALLWNSPTGTPVNLSSTGSYTSIARGTNGTQQIGYSDSTAGGYGYHAMLWTGSAGSAVDLNPSGFTLSYGLAISATKQVGYGYETAAANNQHALLWSGSALSAIDLNPAGFSSSQADGTSGLQQVGYGVAASAGNNDHALLWDGSAGSFVDLNPTGFMASEAFGTSGAQQVGFGQKTTGVAYNAFLWNGSAGSAVDLGSTGFTNTFAMGTNGLQQVGDGYSTKTQSYNALVWSGTADSCVDLQSVLPTTLTTSTAYSISGSTVYGIATDANYNQYAIQWQVVSSLPAMTIASGQTYQFAFNAGSGVSALTVNGLTVNSTANVILPAAFDHASRQLIILNGVGLSLSGTSGNWTSLVDLGNNDLDVVGGSVATVTNQIKQGFNGGHWNGGGGITSTTAASDSTHLTALGVIQNNQSGPALFTASHQFDGTTPGATDVLVKYTYYGDANLDGEVDASDYTRIDNGYLNHLTGWFNGDFNYDGVVNGSDYTLIDNAFNNQGAQSTAIIANPSAVATAQIAGIPSPIPEPRIAGWLGLASMGVLRLRKLRPNRKAGNIRLTR